jgi:hypothetical protein
MQEPMPPRDIDPNINVQIKNYRTWNRASDFLMGIRDSHIFRGQGEDWPLKTRLDRTSRPNLVTEMEATLLSTFKAAAHLYQQNLSADQDDLSWLALMQHHGVPTRLLDWTASPNRSTLCCRALSTKEREPSLCCVGSGFRSAARSGAYELWS